MPQGLKLRSGAYNGKIFVCVGDNCYAISLDMQNWKAETDTGITFDRVIYGNNLFVANSGGSLYISKDGFDWKNTYSDSDNNRILSIAYEDNKYVAVGCNGKIVFSRNGFDWKMITTGVTSELNNIKWIDGQFIAVGDENTLETSSDGIEWKNQKIDHIIADKIDLIDVGEYKNKIYILGSGGTIFYNVRE